MTTLVTITHDGHNSQMDVIIRVISPFDNDVIREERIFEGQSFKGYIHSGAKFEVVEVPKLISGERP